MQEIILKFKVTFNRPEYNTVLYFNRHDSAAFQYGNGTAVTIYSNNKYLCSYDTRYDRTVYDFENWCKNFIKEFFNPEFEPKATLIK